MRAIAVYMKSGNIITFRCKEVTFNWSATRGEYTGYEIENNVENFNCDPKQIEAWKVLK